MPETPDPYAHHPELRGKVADPMGSFARTLTLASMTARLQDLGLPTHWLHSDVEREAMRAETLASRPEGDLWVFAYGSLMWDPAFRFAEVRRAHVSGYARRFILKDIYGGRGTPEAPGLMAALDHGTGCDGLVFRIERDLVEVETEVLWRREKVGSAYIPTFVEAVTSNQRLTALTFIADHASPPIDGSLSREDQIRFIATGTGFFGSSLAYLTNIAEHFAALGVEDAEVAAMLDETRAYLAATGAAAAPAGTDPPGVGP